VTDPFTRTPVPQELHWPFHSVFFRSGFTGILFVSLKKRGTRYGTLGIMIAGYDQDPVERVPEEGVPDGLSPEGAVPLPDLSWGAVPFAVPFIAIPSGGVPEGAVPFICISAGGVPEGATDFSEDPA